MEAMKEKKHNFLCALTVLYIDLFDHYLYFLFMIGNVKT